MTAMFLSVNSATFLPGQKHCLLLFQLFSTWYLIVALICTYLKSTCSREHTKYFQNNCDKLSLRSWVKGMGMHSAKHNIQEPISRYEFFKMVVSELHNIHNILPTPVLFFKSLFLLPTHVHMWIPECACTHLCRCPWRAEEYTGSPGAGVYSWLWTIQHVCC